MCGAQRDGNHQYFFSTYYLASITFENVLAHAILQTPHEGGLIIVSSIVEEMAA